MLGRGERAEPHLIDGTEHVAIAALWRRCQLEPEFGLVPTGEAAAGQGAKLERAWTPQWPSCLVTT